MGCEPSSSSARPLSHWFEVGAHLSLKTERGSMINPNEHTDHMGSPLHVDLELVGLGGGKAGTGGGGNAGMLHF